MYTENIAYQHNGVELEGYLAHNADQNEPKPTVLIGHDWGGRGEFGCRKAEMLAEMGYVGFALDMFGKGKLGTTTDEKMAMMQPLVDDRALLQARVQAALDVVRNVAVVDNNNIAMIGFCFGGLCGLDLARCGADIKAVVSFHGKLTAPGNLTNNIKAKILALHGHDDPMVPPEQVAEFQQEMTKAKADWQTHIYGNTKHAFTNPQANDAALGLIYNDIAAQRSWASMQAFLQENFD